MRTSLYYGERRESGENCIIEDFITLLGLVVTLRIARFNIRIFHVLLTPCIFVFGMDLRTISDYFPIRH